MHAPIQWMHGEDATRMTLIRVTVAGHPAQMLGQLIYTVTMHMWANGGCMADWGGGAVVDSLVLEPTTPL